MQVDSINKKYHQIRNIMYQKGLDLIFCKVDYQYSINAFQINFIQFEQKIIQQFIKFYKNIYIQRNYQNFDKQEEATQESINSNVEIIEGIVLQSRKLDFFNPQKFYNNQQQFLQFKENKQLISGAFSTDPLELYLLYIYQVQVLNEIIMFLFVLCCFKQWYTILGQLIQEYKIESDVYQYSINSF
ncbi:hypothetical protein pb186bvf_007221 [Paramecium bursaria]